MFVNKTDRDTQKTWRDFMGMNYGVIILKNYLLAGGGNQPPSWWALGNLRVYILNVLQQMAWGDEEDLDCGLVLNLFYTKLNERILSYKLMEDIQLWCDEEQEEATLLSSETMQRGRPL